MLPARKARHKNARFTLPYWLTVSSLLVSLLLAHPALSIELLFDGDFESGTLAGWAPGMQGSAIVAAKGRCFSTGDSRGLGIRSRYAALLRGSKRLDESAAASLTSKPFRAGKGILFMALSEHIEGSDRQDRPFALSISILDENNTVLSRQSLDSARIQLNEGCPSSRRDQQFSQHFISTRKYLGQTIKLRFSQHPDMARSGKFSLIDQVSLVGAGETPAYKNLPIAIAGIEYDGLTEQLYLKATTTGLNTDNDSNWNFRWAIDGEDVPRPYKNACINDLTPGNYSATLYIDTESGVSSDTLNFFVHPRSLPASGNGNGNGICQQAPNRLIDEGSSKLKNLNIKAEPVADE